MKSWVIVSVGVALAAAISAKPLSRLRKPEKNDKIRICLGVAVVLAAVVIAYAPRKATRKMVGGAQCTVPSMPVRPAQIGAGYQPYVVPEDLTTGGASSAVDSKLIVPEIETIAPVYANPAKVPDTTAVSAPEIVTDVVVGGTLRLVGDF
jgi:hypothetical protein